MRKNLIIVSVLFFFLFFVGLFFVAKKTEPPHLFQKTEDCTVTAKPLANAEDLDQVMTYYYRDKQNDKIVPAILLIKENGKLTQDKTVSPLLAVFFSGLFKKNPHLVEKWIINDLCSLETLDIKTWDLLTTALQMSETPASKEVLQHLLAIGDKGQQKYIQELEQRSFPDFSSMKARTPAQLDYFWTLFIVTGDTDHVKKIIESIDNQETDVIVREAAIWSLGANARNHSLVLEVVKSELSAENSPETTAILQKIINDVE